ncbi:MAG: sensor histidine kinase [Eubacterium sp.]|nr:sensor histidine kinase [Eubacterium sp.]
MKKPQPQKESRKKKPLFYFLNRLSFETSFQAQLIAAFFVIAAPVLVGVFIGSFLFLSVSNTAATNSAQAVAIEKTLKQLQYFTEDTESLSKDIIFHSSIQTILAENHNGEPYPSDIAVSYYLNNFVANRDFIDSVVITSTDDTVFSTERAFTNVSSFENIRQKHWYNSMVSSSGSYQWFQTDNGLMLCRSIYNLNDYVTLYGYMMLYMNRNYIQEIWDSVSYGETTNLIVLDQDGNTMLQNDATLYQNTNYTGYLSEIADIRDNSIVKLGGKKYVVGAREFTTDNWVLYMITPYNEVNGSVRLLRLEMLLLFGVMILILILISRFCASRMAQPIVSLAKLMDTFHGEDRKSDDFPAELYENRKDEVGGIYRSYQQLTNRMDTLIEEIYVKDLEKKDAELAVLQSQINPHFLYNTLDSINWMAMSNGQDEISEMVTALSDTFRLSLMKSKSPYTKLAQEVEYVKSYLTLQKFRYTERLHYQFQIPPETLQYSIPKFIFQPIVENAIKHGIEHLEDGGDIQISARISDHSLILSVKNDGDGIDVEKMNALLYFDPEHMEYLSFQKGGYGVQNIHRRICIICGTEYGLSFSQEEPKFLSENIAKKKAACTIRLPLHKED